MSIYNILYEFKNNVEQVDFLPKPS